MVMMERYLRWPKTYVTNVYNNRNDEVAAVRYACKGCSLEGFLMSVVLKMMR